MNYYPTIVNTTMGGTIGGTLLVLFNLHPEDITKTAILAGIGAITSFIVSYALSALAVKLKKHRRRNRNS